LALGAAALAPARANATTYTGVQNVGGETVDLSITTDGVIGTLSSSDITAYSVSMVGPVGTFGFDSSNASPALIFGSETIATPTALTETITPYDVFKGDYAADIEFYGFSNSNAVSVCFGNSCNEVINNSGVLDIDQVPGKLIGFNPAGTQTFNYDYVAEPVGTVITLGTVSATPVSAAPEPSAWALMIGGIGGVGLALRRRQVAASLTA
jgi:hypothetical protein